MINKVAIFLLTTLVVFGVAFKCQSSTHTKFKPNYDFTSYSYVYNNSDEFYKFVKLVNEEIYSTDIKYHYGSQSLSIQEFLQISEAVFSNISNLKNTGNYFKLLILETAIIESDLGLANYRIESLKFNNYGMFQFVESSAKHILNKLAKVDEISYNQLMQFYDSDLSLVENLSYNVHFSLGLCAEYYKLSIGKQDLSNIEKRGIAWKKYYNTIKGAGSVSGYVKKNLKYNAI